MVFHMKFMKRVYGDMAPKINIISARKRMVDTDAVNDVISTRQSVITRLCRTIFKT